jgi:hypothetical protein
VALPATHTRPSLVICVHYALVTQLQRRATTKCPCSRDGRSHPLPDRTRLGILDRSFSTAERGLRARITNTEIILLRDQQDFPHGTLFRYCVRLVRIFQCETLAKRDRQLP